MEYVSYKGIMKYGQINFNELYKNYNFVWKKNEVDLNKRVLTCDTLIECIYYMIYFIYIICIL